MKNSKLENKLGVTGGFFDLYADQLKETGAVEVNPIRTGNFYIILI